MTKIKICGIRRQEDIAIINEARPDFCGFIINVPKSPRNLSPNGVRALREKLSDQVLPVGVFVNEPIPNIVSLTEDGTLKLVQLHGSEDDAYILRLREQIQTPIIQAFSVTCTDDLKRAAASPADFILLDNRCGGTGETFDWSLLSHMERPFFLAGGLTPENIPVAISRFHPSAVDISSGAETDGYKDRQKIFAAIAAAKEQIYE